jgi:hypothetical protein
VVKLAAVAASEDDVALVADSDVEFDKFGPLIPQSIVQFDNR